MLSGTRTQSIDSARYRLLRTDLISMPLLDTTRTSCQVPQDDPLEKANRLKQNSWVLSRKYSSFDARRAERVAKCGMMSIDLVRVDGGSRRHALSFLCQDRFCAICARKRSAKLASRYRDLVDEHCHDFYGHMLTVTYKNSEQLRDRSRVSKDIRNLLRRSLWKQYGGIVGGLYSLEVTRGSGGWHPHAHILVFTKLPIASYTDGKWLIEFNQQVSEAWLSITRDSYIVRGVSWDGHIEEVVKYMTKSPEKMDPVDLRSIIAWSRGMRSLSAFGCLYGKEISEDVEEEDIEEGGTYVATLRRFDVRTGTYVVDRTLIVELDVGATVRDIFTLVMGRERHGLAA